MIELGQMGFMTSVCFQSRTGNILSQKTSFDGEMFDGEEEKKRKKMKK